MPLELKQKIELYFTPPWVNREEYKMRQMDALLDNSMTRYSPLYVRRQDIAFMLGQNSYTKKDFAKEMGFGPANTTAVAMIFATCDSLSSRILGWNDISDFFEKFLRIPPELSHALRFLRNADFHGLDPLRYYQRETRTTHIFILAEPGNAAIEERDAPRENRRDYIVSPYRLWTSFETGMNILKHHFLDPKCPELRRFDEAVSQKNWLYFR